MKSFRGNQDIQGITSVFQVTQGKSWRIVNTETDGRLDAPRKRNMNSQSRGSVILPCLANDPKACHPHSESANVPVVVVVAFIVTISMAGSDILIALFGTLTLTRSSSSGYRCGRAWRRGVEWRMARRRGPRAGLHRRGGGRRLSRRGRAYLYELRVFRTGFCRLWPDIFCT